MNKDQISPTQPQVLIVDDVPQNLKILRDALELKNYEILVASDGASALRITSSTLPDIILLDIMMPPGIDGYEVCRLLKQNEATQHIPVIFITVKDDNESLVEGFHVGGVDYITKPFSAEEVHIRVETHLKINRLTNQLLQQNEELKKANEQLRREIERREVAEDSLHQISEQEASHWGISGFIGKSKTIKKIFNDIQNLQNVDTTSVLITGESGTGKELIARAIHFGGTRAKGRFVPVNCSAIPAELAESTLFGHVRGAFTGANTSRKGYFEHANKGTLFLDEIGDMPPVLQTKLLRVLEDDCIVPVGGTEPKRVDVRIIAATNQNLSKKIAEGAFREDLYYRLARFPVNVPPLRERKEDIPLLAEHFLKMFVAEMGVQKSVLSPETISALETHHYPGNVRELKNIIERALINNRGSVIRPEHLDFIDVSDYPVSHTTNISQEDELPLALEQIEELMVKRVRKPDEKDDIFEQRGSSSPLTDEEKILAYLRQHGSINNPECRKLLDAPKHRATYLLQKMHRYGLLVHKGEHRWSRYYLP